MYFETTLVVTRPFLGQLALEVREGLQYEGDATEAMRPRIQVWEQYEVRLMGGPCVWGEVTVLSLLGREPSLALILARIR